MKKRIPKKNSDDMRAEYDFSHGVRGKYAQRFGKGTNLIAIDPELRSVFPDSRAVNDALRILVRAGQSAVGRAGKRRSS